MVVVFQSRKIAVTKQRQYDDAVRSVVIAQAGVADAAGDARDMEALYDRHGSAFLTGRKRNTIASAVSSRSAFLIRDAASDRLLAAACAFDIAGEWRELGGHCSIVPGYGFQRILTAVSLAYILGGGGIASRTIALVKRGHGAAAYGLVQAGFRRFQASPRFVELSGYDPQQLALGVDCFAINQAAAHEQVTMLQAVAASGVIASRRSGFALKTHWLLPFLATTNGVYKFWAGATAQGPVKLAG